MKKYNYKVGDKVLLTNKRPKKWDQMGLMDKYLGKVVTISRIFCDMFEIEEDTDRTIRSFKWSFRFNEIVRKVNGKHFKSYPNNYTGILNIENGHVIEETKKEVLDEEEKKYLEAVLKPFKNEIQYITKLESWEKKYYIFVRVGINDALDLPFFSKEANMYINMKPNKRYTLEELGLFEEE